MTLYIQETYLLLLLDFFVILQKGADLYQHHSSTLNSVIHGAAEANQKSILQKLLNWLKNADSVSNMINQLNVENKTALQIAAEKGRI